MKDPGTIKVLQFPPNLLIQGSRCKTLIQGPTTGAPSKFGGGPSLGRTKFKIIVNSSKKKESSLRGCGQPQKEKKEKKIVPKIVRQKRIPTPHLCKLTSTTNNYTLEY